MFEETVQVVTFCMYYFGMDAKVGTDLGSYTHAVCPPLHRKTATVPLSLNR